VEAVEAASGSVALRKGGALARNLSISRFGGGCLDQLARRLICMSERFFRTWPLAYRLIFGRFILNDVRVLDEDSILNVHSICGNQFTGASKPLNRPCTITRSPSATIVPGSYFNLGGMLLMDRTGLRAQGRYERCVEGSWATRIVLRLRSRAG
jgi:hypothetical protein